jgi:hypothetical protein
MAQSIYQPKYDTLSPLFLGFNASRTHFPPECDLEHISQIIKQFDFISKI